MSKAYSTYRSQPRGRSSRGAFNQPWHSRRPTPSDVRKSKPQCRVCQAEKRPFIGHDIASCHFISESERRTLIRSYQVDVDYDDQHYNDDDQLEYAQEKKEDFHNTECLHPVTSTYDTNILRVATSPSPTLTVFYEHHPIVITCDSGATSSLIRLSCAQTLGIPIKPTRHCANQADGKNFDGSLWGSQHHCDKRTIIPSTSGSRRKRPRL